MDDTLNNGAGPIRVDDTLNNGAGPIRVNDTLNNGAGGQISKLKNQNVKCKTHPSPCGLRRAGPIRVAPPTKTFGDRRHSNQWGRGAEGKAAVVQ